MNNETLLKLLLRLWQHINIRRRVQFVALFIVMFITSIAEVISIGAILPFLGVLTSPDQLYEHKLIQPLVRAFNIAGSKQLLLLLTVTFALAALFSGFMRLILVWSQTRLSHSIGADFSIKIYRRTLYQPYAVHLARNSSEVIAGISGKANSVVYSTLLPILVILSSVLMLITILIALVAIEPMIAFAAFGGLGTIYIFVILITKSWVARDSLRVSREQNLVIKALQEGLGGIRDVLIDGTQAVYCDLYQNADLPLRRSQANIQIIASVPRFGIEALGMILIAVLAFTLSIRPEGISNAIPVLGVLALGAQRLLPVMQQGYYSWVLLRGGEASLHDALELLDQPLPLHANNLLPEPIAFDHNITLSNLAFRYTPESPWVLKRLDLSIPKGSRIGFIGSTGSGKSTLLDIIMGLLYPGEGRITIDGVSITIENYRSWQAHIAHVPQAIYLADTTIAENIAFGVPKDKINYTRVRKSAQDAQISQTIESWENQYQTTIGENGVRLSGGQRQRIGIARALYKKADVIIFDEATSALDNETEQAVIKSIDGLSEDLTLLIVAHRLTTLKNCTLIVELCNGTIKRSGKYHEIVSASR